MSLHIVDGVSLTEGQWLGWCADEEHGQKPRIRATFNPDYPFCVTTPSGEPIQAYRQYKHAELARRFLEETEEE